jgi:EAL domain-containing protein (putative c-di-GMP-specific phosphodiesterase class I)
VTNVHDIVDRRAVVSVFQPLVEIGTGRVLGYEALSRGPAGTRWESPATLFAEARAAGRDAELDWVCRASAYRAALDAGLDAGVALFVNMEPESWRTPCPPDLRAVVERAHERLHVITEMTERAIAEDPAALLSATAHCRAVGWGVALDDVGANPASLALMPFVRPDVVKLDMQLLRAPDDPHTARVVAAVAAYAESTGAVVLAEGIETQRHLATARVMGATVGQGWRFGHPGPLPLAAPSGAGSPFVTQVAGPQDDRTPFAVVSSKRPVRRTTKADLMPLSRHLEALALEGPEPPVLLACFQHSRHFSAATARRFTRIAAHSPLVAALGEGLTPIPARGVRGADLAFGDLLRGEWNVIVVGPHRAAALVAHDLGDGGTDGNRRFDFALTHDRPLVIEAARSLLRNLAPAHTPVLTG